MSGGPLAVASPAECRLRSALHPLRLILSLVNELSRQIARLVVLQPL
jgi:hypothetical protein